MPDAVTQALINNAISNKYPGTLGSDDPYNMYNTQVQYNPSDITYFDSSVDAIRSGAALGRDLPPVSQYTIPPTLPVNPISQLMTTGTILANEWPKFKEDISQGWDAIRDWMPETIEPQDFLPDAIRKGVPRVLEGLGNLIPSAEASSFIGDEGFTPSLPASTLGYDERDRREQIYEALSGMRTGNKELAELEEISAISPGIRERLKGWVTKDVWGDPMQEAETDYTYSFNDPATHAKILDNKALNVISKVIPGVDVSWKNEDVARDLGAELGYGRSLTDAEYDSLVHLTGSAGQPYGGFSREAVPIYEGMIDPLVETVRGWASKEPTEIEKFNIEGLTDFPDQAIQDAVNNMIGNEYWQMSQSTGEPVDVKKMFLDSRVISNLNMGADADPSAEDPKDRPSQIKALVDLIGLPEDDDYDAGKAADIVERYTTPGSQDLIDIATQVESFSGIPEVFDDPRVVADVEDFSAIRDRAAESAGERDREAQEKADERDRKAEKAAADRESAARSKAIERAAEASRKAEAKRVADTEKRAAEQRAALDAASQRALQNHMAWMATQAAKRAEEERLRALLGYGSGDMWT